MHESSGPLEPISLRSPPRRRPTSGRTSRPLAPHREALPVMSQAAKALHHAAAADTGLGTDDPATPAALSIPAETGQAPRTTRPMAPPFSALTTTKKPTALNTPMSEVER